MKLRGKSYRAVTQVKGLSLEIHVNSGVEAVHNEAGRNPMFVKGENVGTRRGLRP